MVVDRKDIVQIKTIEEQPDLSWLGEYTDEAPDPDDILQGSAFSRRLSRREYQYFISANPVPESIKDLQKRGYARGPANEMARIQCRQDYERMESFGDLWWMLGIQAQIELHIPTDAGGYIIQDITSPGLWGVESDGDDKYRDEVFADEVGILVKMLTTIGITVQ